MASGYQIAVSKNFEKPQDYASDGVDGIGFIHFWGLSPAADLVGDFPEAVPRPKTSADEDHSSCGGKTRLTGDSAAASSSSSKPSSGKKKKEKTLEEMLMGTSDEADAEDKFGAESEYYNVLISGGADLRFVMKTVAKWHRLGVKDKKLRFFLHDNQVEVTARHLLFLQILSNTELTPRDRAELFLTLYGNALVRDRDSKYLSEQVKRLLAVASETAKDDFLADVFDFSCLRFKERDELENVIRGWKADVPFDVEQLRDDRMRGYYRARYEHRKNLMDHDYQLNIKPVASIVHWYHYRDFCHTGVAFESRLGSYTVPNRSLASYIDGKSREKGTSVLVRGFWADIINSPYFTFGVDTHNGNDKSRLFKKAQEQHRNTAVDVAEFNLEAWIREMQDYQEFNLPPEKPEENIFPYATPVDALRNQNCVIEEVDEDGNALKKLEDEENSWKKKKRLPAMEGVKLVLLTGNLEESLRKTKFEAAFDRVFFGNMAVLPLLEASGLVEKTTKGTTFSFTKSLKPGCVVTCETFKYQVHFDAKVKLGYRNRMKEAMEKLGLKMFRGERLVKMPDVPSEQRAKEIEFSLPDFVHFGSEQTFKNCVIDAAKAGGTSAGSASSGTTVVNMADLD
ncbi:unnamed protein product [Amoebophrya sp. A120]|nr:unnamed protein product [Amoebophrya sp. A120]|eukprot:GSA120T00012012001.1